jgi:hypothetical protein
MRPRSRAQAEYDRCRIDARNLCRQSQRAIAHTGRRSNRGWKQDKLMREITRHKVGDCSYLEEDAGPTEFTYEAQRVFARQQSNEQKKLLKFVLSKSAWKDWKLTLSVKRERQKFQIVRRAA